MKDNRLGLYLKKARKSCGYTQEFAASHINISRQEYSHYETGRAVPSPKSCQLLAQLFDVSFDTLLSLLTDDDLPSDETLDAQDDFFTFLEDTSNTKKLSGLSRREKELLYLYSRIDERDRRLILEFMKIMSAPTVSK